MTVCQKTFNLLQQLILFEIDNRDIFFGVFGSDRRMSKTTACTCFSSLFKAPTNHDVLDKVRHLHLHLQLQTHLQNQNQNLVKVSTENRRVINSKMGIEKKVRKKIF